MSHPAFPYRQVESALISENAAKTKIGGQLHMGSLVLLTYGESPHPVIYSQTRFDRIVLLFTRVDEESPREENFDPWYITQGSDVIGPVYAEMLAGTEWRPASVGEVAPALLEHGITAVTAWEESFEINRGGDIYLYHYTVEGNGALETEAQEWIQLDLARHCDQQLPQARVVATYAITRVNDLCTVGEGWRSATLVRKCEAYEIWLDIALSRRRSDQHGDST